MSAAGPEGGAVGILGGTFDPPHLAHLAIAEEARDALGLARVLFVPAGTPWQKAHRSVTPGSVRAALVEAAIAGNRAFALERCEVDRPGPSYTVDTLEELAARGIARDPWLILSSEALAGLASWREPERIVDLARLCVAPRGEAVPAEDVIDGLGARLRLDPARIVVLDGPRLAISSTAIRARVRAGRSIRYLVPDAVAARIADYALYRDPPPGTPPADHP